MTTSSYQYTIFDKIKFGFSVFFRCFGCFRNIYEKWQFLFGMVQTCSDSIPFLTCPYCGDKVYILEKEPGTYQLCFECDQSTLTSLSFVIKGVVNESYTIIWGDNTLSTGTFTLDGDTFTHDYVTEGIYYIKIYFNPNYLIRLNFNAQPLIGSFPSLLPFVNLTDCFFLNINFSGTFPDCTGISSITDIRFTNNSMLGSLPDLSLCVNLTRYALNLCNFSGSVPDLSLCTSLVYYQIQSNQLTGSLPDISSMVLLNRLTAQDNLFTGNIPAFGSNSKLVKYRVYINNLTGVIPNLSNLIILQEFSAYNNQLAGYTASSIALTCTNFQVQNNLLTQVAIDQILLDFYTNLSSRPGSGTINLGGTGNAAPSATGLTYKAAIIAHGWTVTTN